jgi:DNA-binding SARP family transcriptional activator
MPDTLSRVRLVGRFAIERGSEILTGAELGSRKARTLIKLLAVRRGQLVPLDTVLEALWGNVPPAKAPENVASLVSRLRAVLGADLIDGGREGYRLRLPAGCEVDVDEAGRLVAEARSRLDTGAPALAVTASDRALEVLGTGRLLTEETDVPWVDEANREAAALLQRAREISWRARFALDDHRGGLAVAEQCLADDPFYEAAHRAVMLAQLRLGEPAKALATYERLRDMLAEEFGADPTSVMMYARLPPIWASEPMQARSSASGSSGRPAAAS